MSVEIETNIFGWLTEIAKAAETAELITTLATATAEMNFSRRSGAPAEDVIENIRWALCQVASRATVRGSLRLVPVMDKVNHNAGAHPLPDEGTVIEASRRSWRTRCRCTGHPSVESYWARAGLKRAGCTCQRRRRHTFYVFFIIACYTITIPNITIRNTGRGNAIVRACRSRLLLREKKGIILT